jgi:hypothetical protein
MNTIYMDIFKIVGGIVLGWIFTSIYYEKRPSVKERTK